MSDKRSKFVKAFGEEQTAAIEAAAEMHWSETNGGNKGPDPFKWVLLIAIGYGCIKKERFREYHGITVPYDDLKSWIIESADLDSHVGDSDYLAMFCGTYNEFVKPKERTVDAN